MVNIYFEKKRGYYITFRKNKKNFFRTLKGFKNQKEDKKIVVSIAKTIDAILLNQQRTDTVLKLLREVSSSVVNDFRLPLSHVWQEYISRPNKKQNNQATEKTRGFRWNSFIKFLAVEYSEIEYLHEINPTHIQRYMDLLFTKHKSPTTINNTIGSLSVIWQRLMIDYNIYLNPCKTVEKFKAIVIQKDNLTPAEITSLWAVACRWATNQTKFWAWAVAVSYYTGLRIGDIANIKYENIDIANKTLTVLPRKTAKTNQVPLIFTLHADMLQYIPLERVSEFLFPWYAKAYNSNDSKFWDQQRKLFAEANIATTKETTQGKRTTKGMHSLRVHYATSLLGAGVSLSDVQSGMGHSNPAMTASYNRTNDAGIKNIQKIKNIS